VDGSHVVEHTRLLEALVERTQVELHGHIEQREVHLGDCVVKVLVEAQLFDLLNPFLCLPPDRVAGLLHVLILAVFLSHEVHDALIQSLVLVKKKFVGAIALVDE